jgi:MFS transporter, DHA1 family, inner membrane transport protein
VCPLRYHVVAEGGWDLGTAIGCTLSAGLVYAGFSFFWPILLGLAGSALGYWVLVRNYEIGAAVRTPI